MKIRVVVESPYAGNTWVNERYARAAMADCLKRGEAPFASHLLYTQDGVLDDEKPEERKLGMEAGFLWGDAADRTVVYVDLGVSGGMKAGIARAELAGRPVEMRTIPNWDAKACAVIDPSTPEDVEVAPIVDDGTPF